MSTVLGEILLVLVGLALVLLAVILVLAEAQLILRLGSRLHRTWKSNEYREAGLDHREEQTDRT